jgi:hypothetical protein
MTPSNNQSLLTISRLDSPPQLNTSLLPFQHHVDDFPPLSNPPNPTAQIIQNFLPIRPSFSDVRPRFSPNGTPQFPLRNRLTPNPRQSHPRLRHSSSSACSNSPPLPPRNLFPTLPSPPTSNLPLAPVVPRPPSNLNPHATPFHPTPPVPLPPSEDAAVSPQPSVASRWRTLFNYSHNYRLAYQQQPRLTASLSETNLKSNVPWGDEMSCPKNKNTFRLYSQNINGLKVDDAGGDLATISDFINTYQCDAVGFSELNLDVSKY